MSGKDGEQISTQSASSLTVLLTVLNLENNFKCRPFDQICYFFASYKKKILGAQEKKTTEEKNFINWRTRSANHVLAGKLTGIIRIKHFRKTTISSTLLIR